MFDPIGRDDILTLVDRSEGPCVSVFLPTHTAGPETQQGPIRLKNLRRAATRRLRSQDMRSADAEAILEPLLRLENDAAFWSRQGEGLAVFVAPGFERWIRLAVAPDERVVVGRRFHVRPLLAAFLAETRCYVLALSQRRVRLVEVDTGSADEVPLEDVPGSLEEALAFEDPERQLRQRSGPAGTALFHGHGVGKEEEKERISRFFRLVDPGIVAAVRARPAPVVIAAVDYLVPLYRAVTALPDVVDQAIEGNPDDATPADLAPRARAIVAPQREQAIEEDAERYLERRGTGRTGCSPSEVVPAAVSGRIEVLFVPGSGSRWGTFDADGFEVEMHPARAQGDEDLLDTAAVETWRHGGRVHVVDPGMIPGEGPLAAVYRF